MDDPAAIAARLTEAQKLALQLKPRSYFTLSTERKLKDLGLIEGFFLVHTPLGRAVLAALDKEPK